MFDKQLTVYTARSMTGRINSEVFEESKEERDFLRKAGFNVLCPIEAENIKNNNKILLATKSQINEFWPRDKEMIRESHILFHMTPHLRSDGAWHEVGYMRYHLQGPVVHIYPAGKLPPEIAVSYLEDDYVCDSLEEAIEYTLREHGTFLKRTLWRLSKLNRCLLKSIYYQAKEWFK